MEIIKITSEKLGADMLQTVNSRDLWAQLEIKKDYSNWMKSQIESLDLDENIDYLKVALKGESNNTQTQERGGDRRSKDYIITLDTAKHIAMASRTSQGKKIRNYFINIEKKYINNEREKFAKLAIEELGNTKINTIIGLDEKQELTAVSVFFNSRKFVELSDIFLDILKMSDNNENSFYQSYVKTLENKLQELKELNNNIAHISVDFNHEISFFKRYEDKADIKKYSKTKRHDATREFINSFNEKYQ